ncbi:MAG TPA: DUF2207 domain-containing protein [Promineifilum sp.]|nr:DUF2207 domain-containing protein [Promineifilum sp.]
MLRKLALVLLLIALFFSLAAQSDKSYSADRFDVDVAAQADRSLLVTETVAFRFVGGPFSFVFRELPTDHTDGITNIVAGVDGVPWPEGTGPGQVEITGRNPIVITWHLSPTSDVVQNFTLSYQVLGVVRRGEQADVLDWQALPDEYEYDIASSTVTVNYPTGMTLQGEPEVLAGKADFASSGNRVVFTQGNLSAGDPLVVRLSFPPGSFAGAPPAWQTQREAQNRWSWAWIAAAVATLIGGLLAIFAGMRGFSQPTRKPDALLHKPPVDLPPALAGWLFNQSITWPHGLATLLDLAGRGVVAIEEATEKKWYRSADFLITLLKQPADARPHERALLDLLFTDRSSAPQNAIRMSDMGRLITSSRWKTYTESLETEADAQGLISAEAKQRRNRFLTWGVMLLFLAGAIMLVIFLVGSLFGWWPFLLAAAVALLALVAFIAGAAVSPLSDRGTELVETFAPFRRFIEQVSRGKIEVPDPAYYEAHLPYATAFGYAVPWVKKQVDEGYSEVPAYFHALNADDGAHVAAWLVAVTAATNSGGSAAPASAAGAAGAGAAGGGASGAG